MEFEDVLMEVGDYGKYQRNLIMIFLVPAASLLPWFSMNILFMVSVPDHWCYVPELSFLNLSMEQQKALVAPYGEKCMRYDVNFTNILDLESYSVRNGTPTRPCDHGWEYDHTYWDDTASTKWNMVCNDSSYNSHVLTLYNVGSIIGTPIYGALSDKIGRKITFFITIIITAVTAISSVLMENFIAFVVIKTINGSLMPSVFQLPFIIILEIVAPEMRTRMNAIVNISWTVGVCILPLIAYFSRSWVTLGLLTSSVTLIFLLYYMFLPESPRWLLSQERYDEAANILYRIGQKNEKIVEKPELVQKLKKLSERMKKETTRGNENSPLDLVRYPQLRKKFFIITFCWMANIMSYYGLQLNISNLAGNEFINFFLLGVAEMPGYFSSWYFMERFGRRWCAVAGFLLTGIVCMLTATDFPYSGIICSMFGKYFAALTFMATYQQSSELYPTVVRSLGMGMSSTVAMIATLIVPYIVELSEYGKAIPFVIIGWFGICAGILAAFLPETLNENLPQSINDAEKFGLHQKFFSWNRRRLSVSRERASIKLKVKPDGTGVEDDESKIPRSSQILQNIEFVHGPEMTCISVDSVNVLNSGTHNVRKRNSADSYNNECYAIDAVPERPTRNSVSERKDCFPPSVLELKQNIDDDKHDKPERTQSAANLENDKEIPQDKAPVYSEECLNEKFSYVNMVFDNKDAADTKNDDATITDGKSSSGHSDHDCFQNVDG